MGFEWVDSGREGCAADRFGHYDEGRLMNLRSTTSRRAFAIDAACRPMMQSLEKRLLMTVHTPSVTGLQAAIDAAVLGDTILLDPTKTYVGGVTLKNKTTGTGWITIQSANLANLPGPGVRVSPADAPNMANIQAPGLNE